MNLLNIEHISKIYGEKIIFDDASFGVQEGDKIGIVGINGTRQDDSSADDRGNRGCRMMDRSSGRMA